MPLHIHRELPLTLPLPLISTTSSRPCVRGVPSTHFSSLRQLAEMPSLAGPISRAQLASFTRLDDGAFCRVISASLWAPPTPVATPGQPAAPKQVVQLALRTVSWHLLCHWPLVCLFFSLASPNTCSSHCARQARTHGHGAIWLAGRRPREIYTRAAGQSC